MAIRGVARPDGVRHQRIDREAAELIDTAIAAAETICGFSAPSVMMAKEAVNRAYESPLSEGISYERRLFHALFGTEDKTEGMEAFLAKRKPEFRNR